MDRRDKLNLLKTLRLLERVPDEKLAALAEFLEPQTYEDGGMVFDEGSTGDSLFFVSAGIVRISKKVREANGSTSLKELAVLHAGDYFGEMVLFEEEEVQRSARATAAGKTVLFKLERGRLQKWLESNPTLAVGFFSELVQVLSKRLRRSSNELTLLFDLSRWLLEPVATSKELLQTVLSHLVPHLEGSWAAGAYLYNEFNDEIELVAKEGDFAAVAAKVRPPKTPDNAWVDPKTYVVPLPGKKTLQGYLVFRSTAALNEDDKSETARTLTTTARLITSALENIRFRTEEALRARLAANRSYAKGI